MLWALAHPAAAKDTEWGGAWGEREWSREKKGGPGRLRLGCTRMSQIASFWPSIQPASFRAKVAVFLLKIEFWHITFIDILSEIKEANVCGWQIWQNTLHKRLSSLSVSQLVTVTTQLTIEKNFAAYPLPLKATSWMKINFGYCNIGKMTKVIAAFTELNSVHGLIIIDWYHCVYWVKFPWCSLNWFMCLLNWCM